MALVDIDSPFSERFEILHERTGRESDEIYPRKIITENEGKEEILKIDCEYIIYLSLLTEEGKLVFFEQDSSYCNSPREINPKLFYIMGCTDGKTERGVQIKPFIPIMVLRKKINEIKGEDWYGNDENCVIIRETYRSGGHVTMYFLKRIAYYQFEFLEKYVQRYNERSDEIDRKNKIKIISYEIDKIPEDQKKNILVQRIILLGNLFNPKTIKPI